MLLVDIFVELFICLCLFSNILNSVSVFNCFNRPICDLILTVHMEKMTERHYIRLSYHNLGQVRQNKYMVLWRKICNTVLLNAVAIVLTHCKSPHLM